MYSERRFGAEPCIAYRPDFPSATRVIVPVRVRVRTVERRLFPPRALSACLKTLDGDCAFACSAVEVVMINVNAPSANSEDMILFMMFT